MFARIWLVGVVVVVLGGVTPGVADTMTYDEGTDGDIDVEHFGTFDAGDSLRVSGDLPELGVYLYPDDDTFDFTTTDSWTLDLNILELGASENLRVQLKSGLYDQPLIYDWLYFDEPATNLLGVKSAGSYTIRLDNGSKYNALPAYEVEVNVQGNPIPTPSTLVGLVSMGLMGAFGYVWRRRRRAA